MGNAWLMDAQGPWNLGLLVSSPDQLLLGSLGDVEEESEQALPLMDGSNELLLVG